MCIKKRREGYRLGIEQTLCLCISVSNFVYIFLAITLNHTPLTCILIHRQIKPREKWFPYMARNKQTPCTNTHTLYSTHLPTQPIFKNEELFWLRQRSRRKRVTVYIMAVDLPLLSCGFTHFFYGVYFVNSMSKFQFYYFFAPLISVSRIREHYRYIHYIHILHIVFLHNILYACVALVISLEQSCV